MNLLRHFTIRGDDVAAYLWHRANEQDRVAICQAACVSDVAAIFDWHELSAVERLPLMYAIVLNIENTVLKLRHEYKHNEERVA